MSKQLLKSTASISVMTFISRIFGFLRDMVVAHIFGANAATDAFYVTFKIPNLLRRLFAEGSFSQAFVPVLSEYKIRRSPFETQSFINNLAGTLAFVLFIVTVASMVFAPLIVNLFAPGFSSDPAKFDLATMMLRITFPYLFFISLTAFIAAILNTHEHFAIPAITPVFLNITLIFSALYLSHYFSAPIVALAWGVLIAGVIQLAFLLPFIHRLKLMPRPKITFKDEGVKRVMKLMIPALFGVSLAQISILIDTMFASFLREGSISWLYSAERLMEFPLGVFGVALSTVVLPHLSKRHAAQSPEEYSHTIDWAIRAVLVIGIPAAVALIILAGPLLTSLFNYGKYTGFDVEMSKRALIAFSAGIPFFMLIKIFASGFYARQNIKTPVKIAAIALGVNIVLNFAFIVPFQHAGLALASSVAAVVNAGVLFFLLYQQGIYKPSEKIHHFMWRLAVANVILAITLFFTNPKLSVWFGWRWYERFAELALLLVIGAVVYLGTLRLLGWKVSDLINKHI
jgi:putative peptidoglycan lipid II flippase